MKIKYKGKEYPIWYNHNRLYIDDGTEAGEMQQGGGHTRAFIRLEDDIEIDGFTMCSLKDNYSKKMGRIKSWGRLISNLCKFDEDFKKNNKEIWK